MKRRWLLQTAGGAVATTPFMSSAGAQALPAPVTIGRLHPGSSNDPALALHLQAFREGMRRLGYIEDRNYRIEARYGGGDAARMNALAAELVHKSVDLIVAAGSIGVRAAKEATSTIPIVMAMSGPDPVGAGLIASLARPGGNVTGFTGQTDEAPAKQLDLLREIVPSVTDILVVYNPAGSTRPDAALAAAALTLGLRLHLASTTRAEDLPAHFARITDSARWGVIVLADPAVIDRVREQIVAQARRRQVPTGFSFRNGVEAGGLFSFGIDLIDMHRRSAGFVDRILRGARPAELPVEQSSKFELVVSQKAARELGITVPVSVLARADEVVD